MADRRASRRADVVPVAVAMCAGKDCRKRCEFGKVRAALDPCVQVIDVKCVGLCKGPVVALVADDGHCDTYARLRTKRDRTLLVSAVGGDGRAREQLGERLVSKAKVGKSMRRRLASK